ncbi:Cytochrome P450 [Roseomonas rosea]|uniref:Cytochrome P450 n=1 Tax=Muricoccus roseus TaxID=198092 RepID=A0A1M6F6G9_9PROT|nr:cytochrome P450 [Roseomonas rosea]SHI93189.1 Cytochrome P450 [Roseomonas rosea]
MLRGDVLAALPRVAYRRQVMAVRMGKRQIIAVNDPEVVRDVFITRAANYGRKSHFKEQALQPVIGKSLFANHGEIWTTRRPPIGRLLHPSGVGRLQPLFQQVGAQLAARWAGLAGEGGLVDVAPDLATATLDVMLLAVFGPGVPEGEARAIAEAFTRFQSQVQVIDLPYLLGLPNWLAGRHKRATLRAAAEIQARIAGLIAMLPGEEGYLGGLRALKDEDGQPLLDETGLLEEVAMLLLAGSETAANALAWTLYLLSTHPEWQDRVREEVFGLLGERAPEAGELNALVVTKAVIQEGMRLYPPVAVLARQPLAPDRIRRWTIQPGDTLLCIPWLLHRHEAIWEHPHAFHPERFLPENAKAIPRFAYLPFGLGPRVCAGAAFGMAEMTTFLAMLLQRFDLGPGPVPVPRFRLTLRPEGGMRLLLRPRAAVGPAAANGPPALP